MTDVDHEPFAEPARTRLLDHATVENEAAPDECAIFPRDGTESELETAWIVALEDGFVDLDAMR